MADYTQIIYKPKLLLKSWALIIARVRGLREGGVQSWPKKCVISPMRQQAESRNLGHTFFGQLCKCVAANNHKACRPLCAAAWWKEGMQREISE